MFCRTLLCSLLTLLVGTVTVSAGEIYQVTSRDGDKTITYQVRFGGGRMFEQFTAFNPETKEFVYLNFNRTGEPPSPAAKIWDYRTGETIPLYNFSKTKSPLPVIPDIESMKVCPFTGDKNFKAKLIGNYD